MKKQNPLVTVMQKWIQLDLKRCHQIIDLRTSLKGTSWQILSNDLDKSKKQHKT